MNQQTQTQQPFDPSVVRRHYNSNQWQIKEDWYVQQCNSIIIPDSPLPAEVQRCAALIDRLLSIARLDYSFVRQQFDTYSMQLKIEEKRLFIDLKVKPPVQYSANTKFTVDEMKGVVASVINTQPWGNTRHSLYKLVEIYNARNIFMEGVIKLLQDKKDLLVTHNAMLKIESSVSSMQGGNVPPQI